MRLIYVKLSNENFFEFFDNFSKQINTDKIKLVVVFVCSFVLLFCCFTPMDTVGSFHWLARICMRGSIYSPSFSTFA